MTDPMTAMLIRIRTFHRADEAQLVSITRTPRGWVVIAETQTAGLKHCYVSVFSLITIDETGPQPILDSSFPC